jgi:hypothetical protein
MRRVTFQTAGSEFLVSRIGDSVSAWRWRCSGEFHPLIPRRRLCFTRQIAWETDGQYDK